MIIDFTCRSENEDMYIKEIVLNMVSLFGYMEYEEIVDFFPAINEQVIRTNIIELVNTKQLFYNKDSKYYSLYLLTAIKKKAIETKLRDRYYEIICFIRYLFNCKSSEGYLINQIDCIGTNTFPFRLFIVCNNKVYDIAHCTKNNIITYGQVLERIDDDWDKTEADFKNRQPSDSPYLISEERNRIIIVDDIKDMDFIHFRKVKYIVCRHNNEFLIKAGE